MKKRKVMIDCDTGIDDAVALVFACGLREKFDILGVTTVAGNVALTDTTRNTLNVLNLIGADDIPVAKGADRPMEREGMKASGVHGVTGLRGYEFTENSTAALADLPAWDFIYEKVIASEEKVTLMALGPVTNIALMLKKYPDVKDKLDKIVFMGTSYHDGNPTSIATFNVLVDPEAFRFLLHSGIDVYACPLETTRTAYVTMEETKEIGTFGNQAGELVSRIIDSYGVHHIEEGEVIEEAGEEEITEVRIAKSLADQTRTLHDAAVVAYVAFPELFTVQKYYCDVECRGELTTGFTLIDKRDYYGKSMAERNLFLMESVNREGFVKELFAAIKKCK